MNLEYIFIIAFGGAFAIMCIALFFENTEQIMLFGIAWYLVLGSIWLVKYIKNPGVLE